MYRVFKRQCWKAVHSDHRVDGLPEYVPYAVPMDECNTIAKFETADEAKCIDLEGNEKWRKHTDKVRNDTASPTQLRTYYLSDRYEWTFEK